MKSILIAAAAIAALTGSSFAADIPARAPVYKAPVQHVAKSSWTGCYVGAGGGFGMWNQEHNTYDPVGLPYFRETTSGGRGYFGTVQVGCDYQMMPQIVIGAFADYDFASLKGDYQDSTYVNSGEEKLKWSWAAGGRIGWLPYDTLLTYFSAGYTQAHFDQITATSLVGTLIVPSHTYGGYFLGSGFEYKLAFWPGLTWKTEYRYATYDKDRLLLAGTDITPGDSTDMKKYVQTIRTELVWRF